MMEADCPTSSKVVVGTDDHNKRGTDGDDCILGLGGARIDTGSVAAALEMPEACPPGSNIVIGSAGPDYLVGTAGDDCILGLDGDDVIEGGETGNDTIYGGPGNDTIYASFGNTKNPPAASASWPAPHEVVFLAGSHRCCVADCH
jgi:Ca2+-binding RTX toxin-like protein